MASLIVCTPGGTGDNCYVTMAQATAHYANSLREDTWGAYSTDDRERALIQATTEIEDQGGQKRDVTSPARPRFSGTPYDTDTAPQALHFPRGEDIGSDGSTLYVPDGIKAAVCEQALWLLQTRDAPDLLDRGGLQGQGVTAISIDGHTESYGVRSVPDGIAPRAWTHLKPFVQFTFGSAGKSR